MHTDTKQMDDVSASLARWREFTVRVINDPTLMKLLCVCVLHILLIKTYFVSLFIDPCVHNLDFLLRARAHVIIHASEISRVQARPQALNAHSVIILNMLFA